MSFANLDCADHDESLAEINMVPLIDVMLVLLIIFMVTAPLLSHAIKIDLPQAESGVDSARPEHIELAIDASGQLYWNSTPIDPDRFAERLKTAADQNPQPELRIRAERTTPYEKVAQVLSEAGQQGLTRIGFITNPIRKQ